MKAIIEELLNNSWYLFGIVGIIVFLVTLVIILTLMINHQDDKGDTYNEAKAMIESLLPEAESENYDIEKITKALEAERLSHHPSFTNFEEEQEEKAIISYEQLMSNIQTKVEDREVKKVTLPTSVPISHHRASLDTLIHEHETKDIVIKASSLTKTKSYLDDLRSLQKKLK